MIAFVKCLYRAWPELAHAHPAERSPSFLPARRMSLSRRQVRRSNVLQPAKPYALRRRSKSKRSGVSMLEIMVVTSVATTLMAICVGWIHRSMTFASSIQDREQMHQSLLRLSRELRDDVNAATALSTKDAKSLQMEYAEGLAIVYAIDGSALSKTVRRNGEVVKSERFRLTVDSIIGWNFESLPESVSLVVRRPSMQAKAMQASAMQTQVGANETASEVEAASTAVDFHFHAVCNRWPGVRMESLP